MEWDESKYGPRSEHTYLDDRDSLDGWKVGDRFQMFEDQDDEGPFSGEQGKIIGIGKHPGGMFRGPGDVYLVDMDDYEEPVYVDMYKFDEV